MWICEKDGHCVDSCEGCEHYVEMVEVKRGRWILKDENGNGVCSNCHRQDNIDPLATHCRYCGADMREVDHAKT